MIKTKKKTIIVAVALCMLLVSGLVLSKLLGVSFANNNMSTVKVGNGSYILYPESLNPAWGDTALYLGPINSSVTSVTIPDTIKVRGVTYSVTEVEETAMLYCEKVKKLTIGKNVSYIGKNAFAHCKNLKNITVNTTGLSAKGLKKGIFTGINKKAVVTVPESKLDDYKNLFKTKGLNGKKQTVKGKKIGSDIIPNQTFGEGNSLKNPNCMVLWLGPNETTPIWTRASIDYEEGDTISFGAGFALDSEIYGRYLQRAAYGKPYKCKSCERRFKSYKALCIHWDNAGNDCSGGYSYSTGAVPYVEDYWLKDTTPCKVELCYTLPEGLVVKEDSLKLRQCSTNEEEMIEIDRRAYNTEVSMNTVIFNIDNIKSEYFQFEGYEIPQSQYHISFEAVLKSTASSVNTVTSSIHYSYKGLEKTAYADPVTIYVPTLQVINKDKDGNALNGSFTLYRYGAYSQNGAAKVGYYKYDSGTAGSTPLEFKYLKAGKYKLVNIGMSESYSTEPELSVAEFEIKMNVDTSENKIIVFDVVNHSDNSLFTFHANKEKLLVDATFDTLTD